MAGQSGDRCRKRISREHNNLCLKKYGFVFLPSYRVFIAYCHSWQACPNTDPHVCPLLQKNKILLFLSLHNATVQYGTPCSRTAVLLAKCGHHSLIIALQLIVTNPSGTSCAWVPLKRLQSVLRAVPSDCDRTVPMLRRSAAPASSGSRWPP